MQAVSAREVRLFNPLMRLQDGTGDLGAFSIRQLRCSAKCSRAGFVPLGERPGEEIAVGAVGRFWSLGNRPRVVEDFAGFDEPGFAKAALNFHVAADGEGSRITTETRIAGTDAAASRKFRRYWLLIRLGSGAIRRSWLKAIRRRLAH